MSLIGRLIKNIAVKVGDYTKDTRIPVIYDVGGTEQDAYIDSKNLMDSITNPLQTQITTLNNWKATGDTATIAFTDKNSNVHDVTIVDGLITDWTVTPP